MNEKKNLDRLFQEKFKDFEVAPPEMVWQNIEDELKEKKKRRVVPLWLKLSGVAAVLIIGLFASLPFFIGSGIDAGENPVVFDNSTNPERTSAPVRTNPPTGPIKQNEAVTDASGRQADALEANKSANGKTPADGTNTTTKIKGSNGSSLRSTTNAVAYGKENQGRLRNNTNAVNGKQNGNALSGTTGPASENGSNKTGKAGNQANEGINPVNNSQFISDKKRVNENGIASGTIKNNDAENSGKDDGQKANPSKTTEILATPLKENQIASTETQADSIPSVPENELEKLLREQQLEKEAEKTAIANADTNKWRIKPQMAPVFYNSLSNGSPIDPELAGNSKDYSNDLSYGVGVAYALNDKISIRTGVNTVNLGYSTNDIEFYADMNNQTKNVSPTARQANIVVQNQGTGTTNNNLINNQLTQQTFNGSMMQKMGYIEVPLEMSYKLLNRKFGIDIIGGVSTLFLNENSVSVVSDQGLSSTIGEAENLNNINFSTNIGVGFKYHFWKAFEANFEPTFKYQVNTFSSNAGNFKPYFIGLYSGISFSF